MVLDGTNFSIAKQIDFMAMMSPRRRTITTSDLREIADEFNITMARALRIAAAIEVVVSDDKAI